jgi:ER degradation enhancer, mannosidase alpha-like 2
VALLCCKSQGRVAEGYSLVRSIKVRSVSEVATCSYDVKVCIPYACPHHPQFDWWKLLQGKKLNEQQKREKKKIEEEENTTKKFDESLGIDEGSSKKVPSSSSSSSSSSDNRPNFGWKHKRLKLRDRVRKMIVTTYDSYMQNAFPAAELRPLTCDKGEFNLVNISGITLIDALDTLALLGNYSEFMIACNKVISLFKLTEYKEGHTGADDGIGGFDIDVTVSVFEATIRVLGGLLSAHLLAENPEWWVPSDIYSSLSSSSSSSDMNPFRSYHGELLELAFDLGLRLLSAFRTPTGIPYGSINLRHGVSEHETPIASLAGAGSLGLEFQLLSDLTGDDRFGCAARGAMLSLFLKRSANTGLLGKHIDVNTGKWTEEQSGLGFTADSYYEYLLKMYLLYGDEGCWQMFSAVATSLEAFTRHGDW